MNSVEGLRSLKDIEVCLCCNDPIAPGSNGADHYLPQGIMGPPNNRRNPLLNDIVHNPYNKFRLCDDMHELVDAEKLNIFLAIPANMGPKEKDAYIKSKGRGNPAALMTWLIENYPITENRLFFEDQIKCLKYINGLYIVAAQDPRISSFDDLKVKFYESAQAARAFNRKLDSLTPPPFALALP